MNKNAKNNVLPHTQAKLDLYKSYLSKYLPILGNSIYITAINLFDIFCGTGVYDDGKAGSPIIAAKCILDYEDTFYQRGVKSKPVRLYLNDFDKNKVNSVTAMISALAFKNTSIEPHNFDASDMIDFVIKKIENFSQKDRSLVFIDPYGYSKIQREQLYKLLSKKRSEIILFLPVAQMKRFTEIALADFDKKAFDNLRKFISDFFPNESFFSALESLNIFDYIEALRKAFSYNSEFYTASHYIERSPGNYYSLFFIGSHIYGLEKFIEAKWSNNSLGKGFKQSDNVANLFGDTLTEYDKNISVTTLENLFTQYLEEKVQVSNLDLYEFTLNKQFKVSHMNQLLKDWLTSGKIQMFDKNGNILKKTSGFGLSYKDYKSKGHL
ncbi:MAG: three-Cys-motif partner protein TcmP [Chitinophagaceae bacterium]